MHRRRFDPFSLQRGREGISWHHPRSAPSPFWSSDLMASDRPAATSGSGKHPILMVAVTTGDMSASAEFYTTVFGWQGRPVTPDVTAVVAPAGPSVALRSNVPAGFPGVVPFISVPDVDAALTRVTAAGGAIERAPWDVPMAGRLARFTDPSGTIYGLTSAVPLGPMPPSPLPSTSAPKPAEGSICALEMYAADADATTRFFGELFGWSTQATMPQYLAFDPGAGVGGVFQSHTPALPAVAYIFVADVARKLEQIDGAGGARIGDAGPVPGIGTFGYFKDPSGTTMGLFGV
jgi:predicted enzyme related to lactoylglutathione lyase